MTELMQTRYDKEHKEITKEEFDELTSFNKYILHN